jgi:hypothetical protein
MSKTTETWDTVSGYVFFVRNTRGRTFPMLSTFGLSVADAKARVREMIAHRKMYNRSYVQVVSLARVTLTTDEQLAVFDENNRWQDCSVELQSAPLAD